MGPALARWSAWLDTVAAGAGGYAALARAIEAHYRLALAWRHGACLPTPEHEIRLGRVARVDASVIWDLVDAVAAEAIRRRRWERRADYEQARQARGSWPGAKPPILGRKGLARMAGGGS